MRESESELRKLMDALGQSEDAWPSDEFAPLREAVEEDPEIRRDLARIQAWDRALEQALEEAPVPAGLEQRLLAAVELADAGGENAVTPEVDVQPAQDDALVDPTQQTVRSARRAFWGYAAVALAASLLIAVAFLASPGWNTAVTVAELTQTAEETVAELPSEGWQTDGLPLESYPVDSSLRLSRNLVWRSVSFLGDRRAVIYRDQGSARPVHLIVARSEAVADLPQLPPSRPQQLTGTYMVAAWKPANGPVSVLIFEGDLQRYEQLVRPRAVAAVTGPEFDSRSPRDAT